MTDQTSLVKAKKFKQIQYITQKNPLLESLYYYATRPKFRKSPNAQSALFTRALTAAQYTPNEKSSLIAPLPMESKSNRPNRPAGFKTMAILGYAANSFSLAIVLFAAHVEISQGMVLSALISLLWMPICAAVIIAIFMMTEKKSLASLNLIRAYLWLSMPLGCVQSVVNAAESNGGAANAALTMVFILVTGIPIALYWQQGSHSKYLAGFSSLAG